MIDRIALAETLLFDMSLRDRAVTEDLKKNINIDFIERPFSLYGNLDYEVDELLTRANNITHNAIQKALDKVENVLIPLSGGNDSRLILIYAHELNKNIITLTYGAGDCYEKRYAKKLCEALNITNIEYDLSDAHYIKALEESCNPLYPLFNLFHLHLLEGIIANPQAQMLPVIIGFMGDPSAGSKSTDDINIHSNYKDVLKMYKITERELVKYFDGVIYDGVIADLIQIQKECSEKNEPYDIVEYFFVRERQRKLIIHIFNYLCTKLGIKVIYPYLDKDWLTFFLSLPRRWRANKRLYKLLLGKKFAKFSDIPNTDFFVPYNSKKSKIFIKKAQRIVTRGLQQLIEISSFGKFTQINPFQTENPPAVMNRLFRPEVKMAAQWLYESGFIKYPLFKRITGIAFNTQTAFMQANAITMFHRLT